MTEQDDKTKVIDTDSWWYRIENDTLSISCFMNKKPVKGIFSCKKMPDIYMSLGYVKVGKIKLCLKKENQRNQFDELMELAWDVRFKPAYYMTVDYMSKKG